MNQEWRNSILEPLRGPTHYNGRTYFRDVCSSAANMAMGDGTDFLIRDSEDLVDVVKYKPSELPVDRVMICSILALSCGTVEQALRADQDGEEEETWEEHLIHIGARKLLVTCVFFFYSRARTHPQIISDIGFLSREKSCQHVLIVKGDRGGLYAVERLCNSINGPYPFEVVVKPLETRSRRNPYLQEYGEYTFVRSFVSQGRY